MSSSIPIPHSRALLHITVPVLCFLGVATSRPLNTQNITIEVPNGTTNHGEPYSFCTPATWSNIASYLLLNYVAHGATVVSYPGEPSFDMLLCMMAAILFPTFGVIRALNFIVRHPVLPSNNNLKVATRSGALCMLIRSSSWKPRPGDNIRNALINDSGNESSLQSRNTTSRSDSESSTNIPPTTAFKLSIYRPPWLNDKTRFWSYTDTNLVEIGSRAVFGLSKPPEQYKFAFVPRNTEVLQLKDHLPIPSSDVPHTFLSRFRSIFAPPVSTPKLSSSFNLVKGMVALLQLLYTSFTLYHANGGQINQYGFVAPGLTVLPYAIMSGLNLIASLVAPHYPTLYLVRSKIMDEAERRTGMPFNYVVGKVNDESDTNNDVMEGWTEIAGSFEDNNKLLLVTPSADEDKKIEISDSSSQIIYIPACPKFQRTDDTWTSPLLQFNETPQDGLEFPRCQQDLIPRSWFSWLLSFLSKLPSLLTSLVPSLVPSLLTMLLTSAKRLLTLLLPSRARNPLQNILRAARPRGHYIPRRLRYVQRLELPRLPEVALNEYEVSLVAFIIGAEILIALALSNFSGQQSTVAQRAWIVTWLIAGYSFGAGIYSVHHLPAYMQKLGLPSESMSSRARICIYIVGCSAPAIGGLVVVSQMLKAYGICHRFV